MADAAKKPALSLTQIVDAQRATKRDAAATDDLLAQEAQLYRRLVEFAFSDLIPPAVSLGAQKEALDRIAMVRSQAQHNADREATPEEAAEAEAIAARIAERAKKKRGE